MAKITYTNKTTLNPQPSIADENKVTDDDMNEIKQVVNNNADNVGDLSDLATNTKSSIVGAINELKNAEVYSTTEVKTNEVWKVGGVDKPVYMLEIDYTIIVGTNAWHNVATLNNIDLIKIIDLSVKRGNQQYLNIWNGYNFYFENNTLKEQHSSNYYEGYHMYITVKYTKTTD